MRIAPVPSREEWNKLLRNCSLNNLWQSWPYGQGMCATECWTAHHDVILQADAPIAAVQTFTRKHKKIISLARIQRGPVYMEPMPLEKKLEILDFIRQYWTQEKKHILYISPSLTADEVTAEQITNLGYQEGGEQAWWGTIRFNLEHDEDALFKQLTSKWRNRLRKALQHDLKAEHCHSCDDYDFFMKQYAEFAQQKGIDWPCKELIRTMLKDELDCDDVYMLYLCKDGQRLGGVLNFFFGDTCHAFLNWYNDDYRKMNGNNQAFWEVILHAKEMGYKWFEIGGVDELRFPGITRFKRTLGGEEHELIGPFCASPKGLLSTCVMKLANWRRERECKSDDE